MTVPKTETVVTFDDKDIRDMINAKAREIAGEGAGSSTTHVVDDGGDEGLSVSVTFKRADLKMKVLK